MLLNMLIYYLVLNCCKGGELQFQQCEGVEWLLHQSRGAGIGLLLMHLVH